MIGLVTVVSSCSTCTPSSIPLNRYVPKVYVERMKKQSYDKGYANGKAAQARVMKQQEQKKKEKPQPVVQHYSIPVPAHISPEGLQIAPHKKVISVTER